ncbi:MAG TPA: hypothetical protein VGL24_13095 [Chthoniobacterales bacterium]
MIDHHRLDPRPARLSTPEVVGMFELFAQLIAFHIDAAQRMTENEALLADERKTAELREQFIGVLGHDLRTPLVVSRKMPGGSGRDGR